MLAQLRQDLVAEREAQAEVDQQRQDADRQEDGARRAELFAAGRLGRLFKPGSSAAAAGVKKRAVSSCIVPPAAVGMGACGLAGIGSFMVDSVRAAARWELAGIGSIARKMRVRATGADNFHTALLGSSIAPTDHGRGTPDPVRSGNAAAHCRLSWGGYPGRGEGLTAPRGGGVISGVRLRVSSALLRHRRPCCVAQGLLRHRRTVLRCAGARYSEVRYYNLFRLVTRPQGQTPPL